MFMKYLYPKYKQQFQNHYNKYDYLCYRTFGVHIEELLLIQNKTDEQQKLADNYNRFNPLLETDCVMNNICRYMETQIKEIKINIKKSSPDYIFNIIYNPKIDIDEEQIKEMEKVYKRYVKSKSVSKNISNENQDDIVKAPEEININQLSYISDDAQRLANLAIYVNYVLYPKSNKSFCWKIFGDAIILNIYDNSNKSFVIPIKDNNGEIDYMGKHYKNKEVNINLDNI